jgi:hypothetical protein
MNININERQRQIISSLISKNSEEFKIILSDLINGFLEVQNIEKICNLINEEFMMKGILPNFEPNAYGCELEVLLDVVNSARLRT